VTLSAALYYIVSFLARLSQMLSRMFKIVCSTEPTSKDAKPRVQPGVHTPFYLTNVGGEPRVKPGVWRPEMWA
jgi:hypothetical protein